MKLCLRGKTRIVLLIGDSAVKISRVRLLRTVARMLSLPFSSKSNKLRFRLRYGTGFCRAWKHYLLAGVYANRNEYEHYQSSKDDRVVPTTHLYLKGLVIRQVRGDHIDPEEFFREKQRDLSLSITHERDQPWQFCRIGGRVLLADYGRHETRRALEQVRLLVR